MISDLEAKIREDSLEHLENQEDLQEEPNDWQEEQPNSIDTQPQPNHHHRCRLCRGVHHFPRLRFSCDCNLFLCDNCWEVWQFPFCPALHCGQASHSLWTNSLVKQVVAQCRSFRAGPSVHLQVTLSHHNINEALRGQTLRTITNHRYACQFIQRNLARLVSAKMNGQEVRK